ncbi:MAG: STAS domain-containing protein [Bryobacteraceae bacterium]
MELLVETVEDIHIVHIRGRLDLTGVSELTDRADGLMTLGATKIVMDCRDLQYVSSSGLGAFIGIAKKLGPDGKLVFAAMNQHVQNVFEMTGIANLFEISGSKEAAVRSLSAV